MDFYNVDDLLMSGGSRVTSTSDDTPSFSMSSADDPSRPAGEAVEGGNFDATGLASLPPVKVEEFFDDFDSGSTERFRSRANTWHGRPRHDDEPLSLREGGGGLGGMGGDAQEERVSNDDSVVARRKAATRRNAWGNQSYADLIARAIESAPDQRLTLSQIYAWMVQNVPFFTDKGDSNSSAGWKVMVYIFLRHRIYIFYPLVNLFV